MSITVAELGARVKAAAPVMALAGTVQKNAALLRAAELLTQHAGDILAANAADLAESTRGGSFRDRLTLNEKRIGNICNGLREVAAAADPIGGYDSLTRSPGGLQIGRRRVPLGTIGMIYEARPEVTIDAAALCIKSGNAVLLRGGREAFHSNTILASLLREALSDSGLPPDAVGLVEDTSRESAVEMMRLTGVLDVLIPRGTAGLIRTVVDNARMPVIETGIGICHVYVDDSADLDMALAIAENAKCSRPSVCNAAECLLVHRGIAAELLPKLADRLASYPVAFRACPESLPLLGAAAVPAGPEDYDTEFLDYILAVKVVEGLDEALTHIAAHSSGHSEAIVTSRYGDAQRFLDAVDAAAVYVNASTRFTDGGVFGMGAEIGISTQKLHARGPLGLKELTTIKYVVRGDGQIRV